MRALGWPLAASAAKRLRSGVLVFFHLAKSLSTPVLKGHFDGLHVPGAAGMLGHFIATAGDVRPGVASASLLTDDQSSIEYSTSRAMFTYLQPRTQYRLGSWYHVVGTYDGVEQRLYIDGKLQAASKEQSGDIDYPPRLLYTLGAYRDDDELYSLHGRIESAACTKNS